ncbi:MAG: 7-carboxy-7-deazaguanine synthase QueE [bacterium]|nr:MAG: 7-carboxy-7-deazaguanine synthase QueE [bacterium]
MSRNSLDAEGYCAEVFHSVQGEGLYVGVLQIFIRTAGCSLSCNYCDTVRAQERVAECLVRVGGHTHTFSNPVSAATLIPLVTDIERDIGGIHSVSLTGGEPLEQAEFVTSLIHGIRPMYLPVYLETNGLSVEAAKQVAPLVDIVSLDIKLPSLCGGGDLFPVYERVLPLFGRDELFCKIVIADGFEHTEFSEAVRLLSRYNDRIPLVIQPATETAGCRTVDTKTLLECYHEAVGELDHVRIIPQCHHLLNLP